MTTTENDDEVLLLKPSPLVSMLSYFYNKYPETDKDAIDSIVVESKCNPANAEEMIVQRLVPPSSVERRDSGSLNDWYADEDVSVVSTRPIGELKVYRLEGHDQFSSSP